MLPLRPRLLENGEACPPGAVAVDGTVAGAALTLSHWVHAPLPPEGVRGDTGTELALAALRQPDLFADLQWAVNDHLDADGLLAMRCLAEPEAARQHGPLLAAAAAVGDFQEWHGRDAFRLCLQVHCRLAAQPATTVLAENSIASLIDRAYGTDDAVDAACDRVLAAINELRRGQHSSLTRCGSLDVVRWRRRRGHAWDPFNTVPGNDDLPLPAVHAVIGSGWQLLVEESSDGCICVLEAPRHSWARTWRRPAATGLDLTPLERLAEEEGTGGCHWAMGEAARPGGFTARLASLRDGRPAPTRLSWERVAAACACAIERGAAKVVAS